MNTNCLLTGCHPVYTAALAVVGLRRLEMQKFSFGLLVYLATMTFDDRNDSI